MKVVFIIVLLIIGIFRLNKERKYRKELKEIEIGAFITFKQFKNMYPVAPDAWDFSYLKDRNYILYFPFNKERNRRCSWETEYFYFKTFHDYKKAIRFIKKIESDKQKLQRLKKDAEIAGWFQTDIDIYRANYTEEMKKQNKKIQDAANRFLERQGLLKKMGKEVI